METVLQLWTYRKVGGDNVIARLIFNREHWLQGKVDKPHKETDGRLQLAALQKTGLKSAVIIYQDNYFKPTCHGRFHNDFSLQIYCLPTFTPLPTSRAEIIVLVLPRSITAH